MKFGCYCQTNSSDLQASITEGEKSAQSNCRELLRTILPFGAEKKAARTDSKHVMSLDNLVNMVWVALRAQCQIPVV